MLAKVAYYTVCTLYILVEGEVIGKFTGGGGVPRFPLYFFLLRGMLTERTVYIQKHA